MRHYEYANDMIMKRGNMPETVAYDTVKSTHSKMDDTSVKFL